MPFVPVSFQDEPQTMSPGQNVNPSNVYPPQNDLPPHVRGMLPQEQWDFWRQEQLRQQYTNPQLPPGATVASDQMAIWSSQRVERALADEKAKTAKLEERLEAMAKAQERALEEASKAREKAERESQEAKHRADMAALEAKITALSEAKNAKKETGVEDWLKILVPLAPVLSTLVATRKDEAKIEAEKEMKRYELSQAQSNQMLAAIMGKKDDSMAVMMPMIVKMMDTNSPAARAEAASMQTETQMMLIKMMSDMMREQNQGPEQPIWYPLVERMLEGMQSALAMSAYQKQADAQRAAHAPAPALPAPAPQYVQNTRAQPVQNTTYVPEQPTNVQAFDTSSTVARVSIMPAAQVYPAQASEPEPVLAQEEEDDGPGINPYPVKLDWSPAGFGAYQAKNPTIANITKLIYENLPPQFGGFHTEEWRHIIYNLHANSDAQDLAHTTAEYILFLHEENALPDAFDDIFTDPKGTILRILGVLPVANANPEYVAEFADHLAENIMSMLEEEDDTDESFGPEQNEEDEIVQHEDSFETATGALAGPQTN